jgi:hypothetical protein
MTWLGSLLRMKSRSSGHSGKASALKFIQIIWKNAILLSKEFPISLDDYYSQVSFR